MYTDTGTAYCTETIEALCNSSTGSRVGHLTHSIDLSASLRYSEMGTRDAQTN